MQGLTCERCGASYLANGGRLVCPHCDHRPGALDLPFPGAGYREGVATRRAEAELELVKAMRYRQLRGLHVIWPAAALCAVGPAAFALGPAPLRSEAAGVGLVYVPLGALFLTLLLWARLPKATWTVPSPLRVHCPLCGGPHEHGVEQVLSRCDYCNASLGIDAGSQRQGLAAADGAVRQAALQHFRAARHWGRGLGRRTVWMSRVGFIWTAFVPVAATAFFFVRAPEQGWEGIDAAAAWAGLSVVVLAGIACVIWQRGRRRALARLCLRPMLDHYGGRWIERMDDVFEWLDVFWSDDYPVYDVVRAHGGVAAACAVRGYPVLAVVNPNGAEPFMDVLLSAAYPGVEDDGSASPVAGAARNRAPVDGGFAFRTGPSGARAGMRGRTFRACLHNHLDLERVLRQLAERVTLDGGQPSKPGPLG